MSTTLNWGKLYEQGRCKDIGVAWTEEEAVAVAELTRQGMPRSQAAAIVREKGPVELEEARAAQSAQDEDEEASGTVPLKRLKKEELLALAGEKELDVSDEKAITKDVLIGLLQEAGVPDRVARPSIEK